MSNAHINRQNSESDSRITKSEFHRSSIHEFMHRKEPVLMYYGKKPALALLPVDEMNKLLIAAGRKPMESG